MCQKYNLSYVNDYFLQNSHYKGELIVHKAYRKHYSDISVLLTESISDGYNLDELINNHNENMINEYKQMLRDRKIKTLLNG